MPTSPAFMPYAYNAKYALIYAGQGANRKRRKQSAGQNHPWERSWGEKIWEEKFSRDFLMIEAELQLFASRVDKNLDVTSGMIKKCDLFEII